MLGFKKKPKRIERQRQMGQGDDASPPLPPFVPVYAPGSAEPLNDEERMRLAQALQEGRS